MSESERRRKYRWDRVLIETDRLFTPQFEDAVVYLTGAQLEMLRNTTQNLRRQETYVSEYAIGYYLTPTVADYDSILAIVSDLEEVLMGNPNTIWGYNERWSWSDIAVSDGSPSTAVSTDDIPEGMVYVVEYWSIQQRGGVSLGTVVQIIGGISTPYIYQAPNLPDDELVYETTHLTLAAGDTLRLTVYGLPNGESCQIWAWGYKMVVPT